MSKASNTAKTLSERVHEAVRAEIARCLKKLPELSKLKVDDVFTSLPAAAMVHIHLTGTDTPVQVTWYRHNNLINVNLRDERKFDGLDYTLSLGEIVPAAIAAKHLKLNNAAATAAIARMR